jgi:rhodanese-related sulfurtransferase
VDGKGALQRFNDPRFKQQRIVFIDARDEDHYREGHIPGAYGLDAYHPEKNLATVLPVCQAAEEIVVYCNGGDCEDSQFAAVTFRDAGIPNPKLFVYAGGMAEWTTNGLPVETGEQNSGTMRTKGK